MAQHRGLISGGNRSLKRLGHSLRGFPGLVKKQLRQQAYKVRKTIYKVDETLSPWVHKLLPNFIVIHYVYILSLIIIGSILIYPQKNIDYIDALFFSAGAATQGGLNTVDLNKLTLFQQIVIYCICMLSTPIFIHSLVVFVRLYWFEKSMDNIKEKSAKNFQMRRTATLAAIRTKTMDDMGLTNVVSGEGYDTHNAQEELGSRLKKFNENEQKKQTNDQDDVSSVSSSDNPLSSQVSPDSFAVGSYHGDQSIPMQNVPSQEDTSETLSNDSAAVPMQKIKVKPSQSPKKDIQFADLPHPEKRTKRRDIDPRDLYMSISMMQHRTNDADAESGPALHINGPAEREKFRLPGHHHKQRRLHRLRRHQQLRLLRQQKQRDVLVRGELSEMEKEEGPDSETDKVDSGGENMTDGVKGTFTRWRRHWSRDSPTKFNFFSTETPLAGIEEGKVQHEGENIPEEAIADDDDDDDDNEIPKPTAKTAVGFLPKLSKKITRTFTSRPSRTSTNPAEMTDNELIRLYSRNGGFDNKESNYLSWTPTVGRNSTFVAMTDSQRQELGGVEYRSLKLLSIILVFYYLGIHIIALICYLPFILHKKNYNHVVKEDGISPTWWAIFTAQTTFNNVGFTLTPDSMMSFNKNAYILILGSFLIVIGNTGFPIFLRFIIWVLHKLSRPLTMYRESLSFLLDHPRRCFTLLFPSGPTWWLFAVLVALNGIDWILFIVLDFNNSSLQEIPKGYRVLDGLFQAFSTRTAGLAVVSIGSLHSAIQVSYMIMMYISVLPLAISIRRTNVYEEQSLGVYLDDEPEESDDSSSGKGPGSYIAMHLRRQLSFDLWFIFLGLFIICICENSRLQGGDYNFQVFQILFEIVSAYGTVGLSLGYPNYNPSFTGKFTTLSKLVIIAMLIRGRHRGLPYSIDRAVILNSDNMKQRDELQAYRTMRRTQTMASKSTKSTAESVRSEDVNSNTTHSTENGGNPWRHALHRTAKFANRAVRGMMMGPGGAVDPNKSLKAPTLPTYYEDEESSDDKSDDDGSGSDSSDEGSDSMSSRSTRSRSTRSRSTGSDNSSTESGTTRSNTTRSNTMRSDDTRSDDTSDERGLQSTHSSIIEPDEISDESYQASLEKKRGK